jgi:hypothetical protein
VAALRVSFMYIAESIGRIGGPAAVAELKNELSNDDIKRYCSDLCLGRAPDVRAAYASCAHTVSVCGICVV